jgi:ferredoxin
MTENPYKLLAERLDALPNGFPPTPDGAELRLLEKLFTPEEAALAARLRLTKETAAQLAERLGIDKGPLSQQLKAMTRKGLIAAGRTEEGRFGYGLLPFVVGIYEMQAGRIDAELAQLFEAYYHQTFGDTLRVQPQVHRVIPVQQSVRTHLAVEPYESAADIVAKAQAWGVTDCICRTQQALIGEPCGHPLDVCMVLSDHPDAFEAIPTIRALTQEGALATLRRAAEAGLVHSVSNNREGMWYICNCCTCACGILRGMADLGIANVVARSSFVNQVDESLCIGCGACVDACQFGAMSVSDVATVDTVRCVGCGVCTLACPQDALSLIRRPAAEILAPPADEQTWLQERATARGIDLNEVL